MGSRNGRDGEGLQLVSGREKTLHLAGCWGGVWGAEPVLRVAWVYIERRMRQKPKNMHAL